MRLVDTIKNIWKIEDLRKRLVVTFLLILVYRVGCYVVLPGIDPNQLAAMKSFTSGGLMQLLDMFSGGAFSQASIFALGIMPYITASIVIQLLGMVLPQFQKLQREGESGHMKINQYTRYLTVLILLLQAPAYLFNLEYQVNSAAHGTMALTWLDKTYMTVILAAGSMFIMWLGERITDKGVGNGISFLVGTGRLGDACNRNRAFVCSDSRRSPFGAGHTQGASAVCEENCRQQAVWRCAPVYPIEG